MTRRETAEAAYGLAFNVYPPRPFAVGDDYYAEVLKQAVAASTPVPDPGGHFKVPHLWPGQIPPPGLRDRWTLVVS